LFNPLSATMKKLSVHGSGPDKIAVKRRRICHGDLGGGFPNVWVDWPLMYS